MCSFSYEREVRERGRERGEGRGRLLRMTEGYIYRGESYRGNVDVKDPYFFVSSWRVLTRTVPVQFSCVCCDTFVIIYVYIYRFCFLFIS